MHTKTYKRKETKNMTKNEIKEFLELHEDKVGRTPGLLDGMEKYATIMLAASDPGIDLSVAVSFQKIFVDFYKLKFYQDSEEGENRCKTAFFKLLQHYKVNPDEIDSEIDAVIFKEVLDGLKLPVRRTCYSYASKLLHTLRPNRFAIFDSVVGTKHFGLRTSAWGNGDVGGIYADYCNAVKRFASSREGQLIIEAFEECYPGSKDRFGELKILDFVFWADRTTPQAFPKSEIKRILSGK